MITWLTILAVEEEAVLHWSGKLWWRTSNKEIIFLVICRRFLAGTEETTKRSGEEGIYVQVQKLNFYGES